MEIEVNTAGKNDKLNKILELPPICDYSVAAKVHGMIVDQLGEEDLVLSAEAVDRCGTAVAQVLLAASEELSAQGNKLRLTGMSETFKQSFADLGLKDSLRNWE
jgi:anti-anti-sigma regulatory factor